MRYTNIHSGYTGSYAFPLNAYAFNNDTVETVLKKMLEFNISKIAVCDEKFKIIGGISKNQIRECLVKKEKNASIRVLQKYCAKDILNENENFTIAYTGTDIKETIGAMRALKTNLIPVAKSPWDKELKGFIELERLEAIR